MTSNKFRQFLTPSPQDRFVIYGRPHRPIVVAPRCVALMSLCVAYHCR